jgi:DNA-binding CsgD family transcriptional regulator/PAS domain-containing protein
MTDRQEDIDRLILDIHAAPLETDGWQGVVESVCHATGADKGLLFSVPRTLGTTFWNVSWEMSPDVTAEYSVEFAPEDCWMLEVQSRGATSPGTLFTGEELIERRDYLNTRFFNEFLVRHDIDRFMNVALLAPMMPRFPAAATLSLYRGRGSESFGAIDRETLKRLTPHLIIAVSTFWRARELSLRNALLSHTVDAVTTPLFVIDHSGRIVFANAAGESSIRTDECLRIEGRCLVPSPSVRERKVCIEALRGLLHGRAATICLTVGPAGRSVILSTAPIANSTDTFAHWGSSAGIVWLAPTKQSLSPVRRVAALFALTSAEERLLAHLSVGSHLTATAEALCVSIHTVRSQLKAIQRKTGWRTQGELVRMVQQLGVIDPKR